jgi:sulfate adenylyltransferase
LVSRLVPPHGSAALKPLLLAGDELDEERARAARMPRIPLGAREFGDLMMLGIGGFTPLDGFMTRADWEGTCRSCRLDDGLFWPIPITLSADQAAAGGVRAGSEAALVDPDSHEVLATIQVTEKYRIDKDYECKAVFGTADPRHPGVAMVMSQGAVNLAGPVKVLSGGDFPQRFAELYFSPAQTRALFDARGWSTVAAFQTRNPMHRSHEHLVRIAAETCDGVLVHSPLGKLKAGDLPAEVSVRAIAVLLERYFPKDTVLQAGYPLAMRYAGPREALLHALFRQNYGCSHIVIGRDHAGVGEFYQPDAAQRIFDEIPPGSLKIQAMKIDQHFWCYRCDAMASARSCPHEPGDRLVVSGTRLREALSRGEEIPAEFSRPEVLKVLRDYYASVQGTVKTASS